MASNNSYYDAVDVFVDLQSDDEDIPFEDTDNDDDYVNEENYSEESEVEEQNRISVRSDDGWATTDKVPDIDIFCGDVGITDVLQLDNDSSVLDFFQYYIDSDLLHHFKQQINLLAQQKLRELKASEKLTPGCRMNKWKTVSIAEIRKYLVIILHMSIDKKLPQIYDHWSKNPVVSSNYCPNFPHK
ncbi:uncharacterized protein LOC142319815 [Lycorma delicatula]|uniref:uncharacterized protein LOC142319815 n=1 Tax=Lycorma delicatula TaxID=130591 RepID=UPI003F5109A8